MSANLLSFIGWTFLPDLISGWVQTVYYGITVRAGDPKPQPGSARYAEHRRRIRIGVIALYLLYTVYEADWEVRRAGDFYQDLGLASPDADAREIKSRFRRLAAIYHPDKQKQQQLRQQPGGGVGGGGGAGSAEAHFVQLKLAQDTLLAPAKRFAYERFGPAAVTQWQHCATVRDFVVTGVQVTLPYYVGGMLLMMVLSTLGYGEEGRYWRYYFTVALMTFELHTVTRPHFPLAARGINALLRRLASVPAYSPGPVTTTATFSSFSSFSSAASTVAAFLLSSLLLRPLRPLLRRLHHPPLLPFQLIILARRITLTLFIALAQLGPLLRAGPRRRRRRRRRGRDRADARRVPGGAGGAGGDNGLEDNGGDVDDDDDSDDGEGGDEGGSGGGGGGDGESARLQLLSRLDALAGTAEAEASYLLALELAPFLAGGGTSTGAAGASSKRAAAAAAAAAAADGGVGNYHDNDDNDNDRGAADDKAAEQDGDGRKDGGNGHGRGASNSGGKGDGSGDGDGDGSGDAMRRLLRARVRDWLVRSRLRAHPDVVQAVQTVVAARRERQRQEQPTSSS